MAYTTVANSKYPSEQKTFEFQSGDLSPARYNISPSLRRSAEKCSQALGGNGLASGLVQCITGDTSKRYVVWSSLQYDEYNADGAYFNFYYRTGLPYYKMALATYRNWGYWLFNNLADFEAGIGTWHTIPAGSEWDMGVSGAYDYWMYGGALHNSGDNNAAVLRVDSDGLSFPSTSDIYVGDKNVTGMYLGDGSVQAYLGNKKVFG